MILTLLLLLIFLACVGFLYPEGMWSNALRLINVLAAALLGHELLRADGRSIGRLAAEFHVLLGLPRAVGSVCDSFVLLLRGMTDQLSRVKVRFPKIVDRIGGIVFSLLIGWVMVCFTLTTLHTAPLGETFLCGSFRSGKPMFLGFVSPDKQWLTFMQGMSASALQKDPVAVFSPHGEFLVTYNTRRKGAESHARRFGTIRLNEGERPAPYDAPPAARPVGPPPHHLGQCRRRRKKIAARAAMSEHSATHFRLSATQDADIVQYHALSGLAVAGLVLGLLSVFALLAPMLWMVPGLGAIVSGAALWRIRRHAPALAGRRLAQCGLLLSIALGVAVPVDGLVYRRLLRNEARLFAALWFEHLRQGESRAGLPVGVVPHPAPAAGRRPARLLRARSAPREALEKYVKTPLVRTLLALGPKATVRYYGSPRQESTDEGDMVDLTYAISFAQPEGQTTLFAELGLAHVKLEHGQIDWQVVRAETRGPEEP